MNFSDARTIHYSAGPARPARGKFPWRGHRSMERVMAEEGKASDAPRVYSPAYLKKLAETAARIERMAGKCKICRGKSPEWTSGKCVCGNTGLADGGA